MGNQDTVFSTRKKPTLERDFILILIAGLAYSTMLGLLNPTVPLSASALGASTAILGVLLSSRAIIQTGLRVPLGQSADRHGWRIIFLIAFTLGIASGATFFFGIVRKELFLFFPALILWGMTNASFRTTEQGYVSDLGPTGTARTQLIGRYFAITGIGQLIGPPLAGLLIETWDFEVVYLLFTLLAFLGFISMFLLSKKKSEPNIGDLPSEKIDGGLGILTSYSHAFQLFRSNRSIAIATFCAFFMTLSFGVGLSFHPLFLRDLGLASFEIGIFIAARDISSLISRLFAGKFSQIWGDRLTVYISVFCVGIGMVMTPSAKDPITAIFPLCVAGFGFGIFWPAILSLIASETKREERGLAMGVLGTGLTIGFSLGSIIFGILADVFASLDYAFFFGGLSTLFGISMIIGYLFLKKDLKFHNSI